MNMGNNFLLFMSSAFLIAFASCQNESELREIDDVVPQKVTSYTFNVTSLDSQTRTAIEGLSTQWVVGDKLGLFCIGNEANTKNVEFSVVEAGEIGKIQSQGVMQWYLNDNSYVYGYYPYDENAGSSVVSFTLPSSQEQTSAEAEQLSNYDYLVASPSYISTENININFYHVMTWIDFVLKNDDNKNIVVNSVDFVTDDDALISSGSVNLAAYSMDNDFLCINPSSYVNKLSVSATGEGWNTVSPDEAITLRMAMFPCNLEGKNYQLVVHTDQGDYIVDKTGKELIRGLRYTARINMFFPLLEVSSESVALNYSGGIENFTIASNMSWTVATDVTWISFDKTEGEDNGTVCITASENTSSESRNASVVVTARRDDILLTKQILITQSGKDATDSAGGDASVRDQGEGGDL